MTVTRNGVLSVHEVESLARQVAVDTEVERIHRQAQTERQNARNQVAQAAGGHGEDAEEPGGELQPFGLRKLW